MRRDSVRACACDHAVEGKHRERAVFLSLLFTATALVFPAAADVEIALDPKATYLRTEADSMAVDAVAIDLGQANLIPGEFVRLEVLGNYSPHETAPDSANGLAVVFSATNALGPSNVISRVSGAIDAGTDVATPPTREGQLPTDVPQDFAADGVTLQIPCGVRYLFVSPIDDYFGDNSDADSSFAIRLTEVPGGAGVEGAFTLAASDSSFEGARVLVCGGSLTIEGTHSFEELVLRNGGIVRPSAGQPLSLVVTGDVFVDASSRIDASALGFGPSEGPGEGGDAAASGGGAHGGNGGDAPCCIAGGHGYGSMLEPTSLGSGGGNDVDSGHLGGAGGGALDLTIGGRLVLFGALRAEGGAGSGTTQSGGGAGGSVLVHAASFEGTGTVSARGGNAASLAASGGGGGGRIALYYGASSFSGIVVACGGNGKMVGGAGTILSKPEATLGSLILSNCGVQGAVTEVGGPLAVPANGTVVSRVTIVPPPGQVIDLTFEGDLTIDVNAAITANGAGFPANFGPGAGGLGSGAESGGGGGHGGAGGTSSTGNPGGLPYGSETVPQDFGSGGGAVNGEGGGDGGGAIRLVVNGALSINGSLSADGGKGTVRGGGGAGGSLFVFAGDVAGPGVITASGGNGGTGAGGGGGGRLAFYTDCITTFNPSNLRVNAGTGTEPGQPGSLFLGTLVPPPSGIYRVEGTLARLVSAPDSVDIGDLEEETVADGFNERLLVRLEEALELDVAFPPDQTSPLLVDGPEDLPAVHPVIPAGTTVNCHLLHFDPLGEADPAVGVFGSATFDGDVLGLILTRERLVATDSILGLAPTVRYSNDEARGLELGVDPEDFVRIEADRGTVTISASEGARIDEVRVLTSVPYDCNDNAIFDRCDVARGTSPDQNDNGIPDECETSTGIADAFARSSVLWLDRPQPNPSVGPVAVRFALPRAALARVSIHDVAGREVQKLWWREAAAGWHQLVWDGRDGQGRRAAGGVYFVRLVSEGTSRAAPIVLLD